MPSRKMNAPSDQTGERPPRVHEPQARERLAALRTSPPPTTLVDPTGEGSAGSHECGSLITIQVRLDGDVVEAAGFRAYGCPETLASAAEAARQVEGRSLLEAALVSEAALIETLELPPDKWSRAAAAGDALHAALGQALLCSARTAATGATPHLCPGGPARVREIIELSGPDIYRTNTVEREVYTIRGTVRQGNSGGPMIDRDGDVLGVVFGAAVDDADTGFVLTADEVSRQLTKIGNTQRVPTGTCIS